MLEVRLKKREINEKELYRAPPREEDCSQVFSGPARLVDDETGDPIAIAVPGEETSLLAKNLHMIKFSNPLTAGRRLSGVSAGASHVFGYSPKRPIQTQCQTCRAAAIHRNYPSLTPMLQGIAKCAWGLMGQHAEEKRRQLLESSKEIMDCWRIHETGFTSGIINKNTPLRYHYDAGNYENSWSAMLWSCWGVSGGGLNLPHYDARIALKDGMWLFFSGQALLHGVTPIKMLSANSYRYSIVLYTNKEMRNCKSMEEELADAKIRRTESERREKQIR